MDIPKLRRDLLGWYSRARRDLPWRRTRDPYAILVSELMLQQTQVKTALPYYEKFMALFPDAAALAAADEPAVLAAWAGLGYYRRARFLKAAAGAFIRAGAFPATLEGIRALPGVGAYTAAAVGSIAFGLPAAVVDGNVIRVLSRLLALETDPTKGEGAARLRQAAQDLLDVRRPGDFNQAVMELGAGVCLPRKPACASCPLKAHCAAHLGGHEGSFPRLPPRPASRTVVKAALLATRGSGARVQVLARVRAPGGSPHAGQADDRLQGFWAFPEIVLESAEWTAAEALMSREARRLLGPRATPAGRLPRVRHRITVHDIHVLPLRFFCAEDPLDAKGTAGRTSKAGWEWVELKRLERLPLASAERKLLTLLKKALAPASGDGRQLGLRI